MCGALISIPEMLITLFQHLLTAVCLGILSLEIQRQEPDQNEDQDLRPNRNANAGDIVRSVL